MMGQFTNAYVPQWVNFLALDRRLSNTSQSVIFQTFNIRLTYGKFPMATLLSRHIWFRRWLGAARQEAIILIPGKAIWRIEPNHIFLALGECGFNLQLIIFSLIWRIVVSSISCGLWLPSAECHKTSLMNIGSGNGLVPSGNKPLPEPMLTNIYFAIWRHYTTTG